MPIVDACRLGDTVVEAAAAAARRRSGDEVFPENLQFHVWDTAQVMAAELRGAVVARFSLVALGVGNRHASQHTALVTTTASALAASVASLAAGTMLLSPAASAAAVKPWLALRGAVSYVTATLTLLEATFPLHRPLIRCVAAAVAAVATTAGSGASTAVIMHLSNGSTDPATRADVAGKELNQDRALQLVTMGVRWALLLAIGSRTWVAAAVIAALSALHMVCNYRVAAVLQLRAVTRHRLAAVLDVHMAGGPVPTPRDIAATEPVVATLWRKPPWRLVSGCATCARRGAATTRTGWDGFRVGAACSRHGEGEGAAATAVNRTTVAVFEHVSPSPQQQLQAAAVAHAVASTFCPSPQQLHSLSESIAAKMQAAGWHTAQPLLAVSSSSGSGSSDDQGTAKSKNL